MRLRVLNCGSCGASTQLRNGAATGFCSHCGKPVTLDQARQAEQNGLRKFPNDTIVDLGMKGTWQGKEYEVIGRIVMGMEEEGETYYWDEFQMQAADGDTFFLEYDEGEWKRMETFTPQTPIGPSEIPAIGEALQMDGIRYLVQQHSISTVHFIQGELTFAAAKGQKASYIDASSGSSLLTIEWKEDEIEFYRGTRATERQVMAMFGMKELVEAEQGEHTRTHSRAIFATICLGLAVLAFLASSCVGSLGREIYSKQTSIDSIPKEGMRFGPVRLKPDERYRLRVSTVLREASAWAVGVVESQDGTELFANQHDFWDESGSDSDGPWHESDLHKNSDFTVDKEEDYYVRIYVEKDPPLSAAKSGLYQAVGFSILEGVYGGSFLNWYGVITMVLAVAFFIPVFIQARNS